MMEGKDLVLEVDLLLKFRDTLVCTTYVLEEACLYEPQRKGLILLISNETTIWAGRLRIVTHDYFYGVTLHNNL
jgi:hypothetical protein